MRKIITITAILSTLCLACLAQVNITLGVNQPDEYTVETISSQTTIKSGESVELGNSFIVSGGVGEYSYQWYPYSFMDNKTIANPIATPTATTTFYAFIEDENGCQLQVSFKVNVSSDTEIDLLEYDALYASIFPNPSTATVCLTFTGEIDNPVLINIIDYTGRIVYSETVEHDGSKIELTTNLNPGNYQLMVKSASQILMQQLTILNK